MKTPGDTTRRRHSPKWRRRGPADSLVTVPTGADVAGGWSAGAAVRAAVGLVMVALGVAALVWLGDGQRGTNPVLALVDPSPSGPGPALRVILLVAAAATSGIGLARVLLGLTVPGDRSAPLPDGVRLVAWVGGLASAATCVVEVLIGQSSRPLGALQLTVSLLVPLLLGSARAVALPTVALAGLLATELGTARAGLPLALDVAYASAGAVLLGASVFGVSDPGALARVAVPAGLVTSVAGVAQLLLTGPGTRYDALHTGYGMAALAQAALPVLVTGFWLVTSARAGRSGGPPVAEFGTSAGELDAPAGERAEEPDVAEGKPADVPVPPPAAPRPARPGRPSGRSRAPELSRLAAGGLVVAFAAAAVLATLPRPAATPVPGQPLLRPVNLPFRNLAVLVLPMRPGPNLVHIGSTVDPVGGGQAIPAGHHGAPTPTAPGTITVSAGGAAVPVTTRPGAPGEWGVLDIPAGADRLTVTADGVPATVPVAVGTTPADPAEQSELAGPDGPECASESLAALLPAAGADQVDTPGRPGGDNAGNTLADCPSRRLTGADADALRDSVTFLAQRGVTGLNLVSDDSPRGVAAADLVRAEAARRNLPIAANPSPGDTLLVVSGWAGAAEALGQATVRARGEPGGGIVLAPWLLTGGVLREAASEVLPLRFNPQDVNARRYAATVAAVVPGETPSAGGYLAWAANMGIRLDERATFYGAAPVDVPMGMGDMDHAGSNPADWYPAGTVVPISPALTGPPGASP